MRILLVFLMLWGFIFPSSAEKPALLSLRYNENYSPTYHEVIDRAQLQFIYENSPWLEKTWKRYPVGRIFGEK
jgi:hypothetical protein